MKKGLFILIGLFLTSCVQKEIDISLETIFTQKENSYYVLFYLDGCIACRNAKLKIEEIDRRNDINYYYIDLFSCNFKKNEQNNIGIDKYEDIVITKAPTLLLIDNKIIIEEYIGYSNFNIWINNIKK